MHRVLLLAVVSVAACALFAENASSPSGDPLLDPPTLHSLGAYWIVKGDDNANAQVAVEFRKTGAPKWQKALPLFRVEKGAPRGAFSNDKSSSKTNVPNDCWLFAGSVLMLANDTEYELKLSLNDPDGGNAEKTLTCRTRAEPQAPKDAPAYHVVPGAGGGNGSADNPFKGLGAAQNKAKPGDIFLLHAGVYEGTFEINKSGEPGKPIVWRGAGDGEAVIDGKATKDKLEGNAIYACGVHDVWFEKLSLRNAHNCLKGSESARLVLRRCNLSNALYGVFAMGDGDKTNGFFISDNTMAGNMPWPTTQEMYSKLPESRAVWVLGNGHVACYNRIHHWKDALDVGGSTRTVGTDFHNNDISECFDDAVEMDFSERNTRCFFNRCTNVFQGLSVQPVFGGPVYVFRNVIYNCQVEPYKMHNGPSGALFFHNTIVKEGPPLLLGTGDKVRNCVLRNNLYIGTSGPAYESTAPMVNCDFDYDGFGGFAAGAYFLKWNNTRYSSLAETRSKAPVYKHAVVVDPANVFASGTKAPEDNTKIVATPPDLRLAGGSAAIDCGEPLATINDGYAGNGPDLGAYELGWQLPHYGPRPEGMDEETAFRAFETAKPAAQTASNTGPSTPTPKPTPAPAIDPTPHRDALQGLLQGDKAKKDIKASMKVWGRNEEVEFKQADKTGLKLAVRGTDLPVRWKDVSDEDLARLASICFENDADALFRAGALAAASGITNLREKISDRLVGLSPEKARELEKLAGKAP